MDALLMCGGQGTRLAAADEKPIFPIGGRPMVDRVVTALEESRVEATYAVVSPHVPQTRTHLASAGIDLIETPGDGYVEDLGTALADDRIEKPILTVVADLPLLADDIVDATLEAHPGGAFTVGVLSALKDLLGTSTDTTTTHDGREVAPVGLNIVGPGPESVHVTYDARLAVNVNWIEDARVAEALL